MLNVPQLLWFSNTWYWGDIPKHQVYPNWIHVKSIKTKSTVKQVSLSCFVSKLCMNLITSSVYVFGIFWQISKAEGMLLTQKKLNFSRILFQWIIIWDRHLQFLVYMSIGSLTMTCFFKFKWLLWIWNSPIFVHIFILSELCCSFKFFFSFQPTLIKS